MTDRARHQHKKAHFSPGAKLDFRLSIRMRNKGATIFFLTPPRVLLLFPFSMGLRDRDNPADQ
jgi:hypothetical protein